MATTVPRLEGPRLKIKRANDHIQDMHKRVVEFFKTHPYEVFTEADLSGERETLKVKLNASPPNEISIIVAEAIYHLRSSLDQLTCELAKANGVTDTSKTYFPFAKDENDFNTKSVQNKIKMLHPDAISMLSDLKPYRGGNDLLWILGPLANIDKHREIISIGSGRYGHEIKLLMHFEAGDVIQLPDPEWQPLDRERTLLTYPAGRKTYSREINLITDVAFREIEFLENKPLIPILRHLSDLTNEIIDIFENRFFN